MQHYHSIESISLQKAWLTIGSFDGVHRGHQAIIKQLTVGAHAQNSPAIVLTFYPHPIAVLRNLSEPFYITTPDERVQLLGKLDIDAVITLPFTQELANTSAKDFVQKLKEHLDLKLLLVGHNFTLGRGREGNVPYLSRLGETFGYELHTLDTVKTDDEAISSTCIRSLLTKGDVANAATLLGRPHSISGEVIHGAGRGQSIGIPTANIAFWPKQILPANGVYVCLAHWKGHSQIAAANIGLRPTFNSEKAISIEAHLLDFQDNIYGIEVQLEFIQRLRGEQKFSSAESLIKQVRQDILATRAFIKNHSPSVKTGSNFDL